jgi:hypothetical protein
LALDATAYALINIQDVDFTLELGVEVVQTLFDLRQIQNGLLFSAGVDLL